MKVKPFKPSWSRDLKKNKATSCRVCIFNSSFSETSSRSLSPPDRTGRCDGLAWLVLTCGRCCWPSLCVEACQSSPSLSGWFVSASVSGNINTLYFVPRKIQYNLRRRNTRLKVFLQICQCDVFGFCVCLAASALHWQQHDAHYALPTPVHTLRCAAQSVLLKLISYLKNILSLFRHP